MHKNLLNTLWDQHVVERISEDMDLLAIDRIFLHDLCGLYSFQQMEQQGIEVRNPKQVFATPDHTLATAHDRKLQDSEMNRNYIRPFQEGCEKRGITLFGDGDARQGIAHIVGTETGLTLPGSLVVCGDSHTCTHGAVGALAFGLGTSEVVHALATSCMLVRRPKSMEVRLTGTCPPDVDAMDIILYILSQEGIGFAAGYGVEYTGEALHAMEMEDRFILCNLAIEGGADTALISPDDKTIAYLQNCEFAPKGEHWMPFVEYCHQIASNSESTYDKQIIVDVSKITRQVSWGIQPGHTIGVQDRIPECTNQMDEKTSDLYNKAYSYMDLAPGQTIAGTKIQRVFVGSCSHGRLSTLKKVADVVKGQHVAPGVEAWIVPGSMKVKQEAEELGLDKLLMEAGFHFGEPCCSFCLCSNGEVVPSGERCVSTTNRNFVGRQGTGARTHLASARTAALAAIHGIII